MQGCFVVSAYNLLRMARRSPGGARSSVRGGLPVGRRGTATLVRLPRDLVSSLAAVPHQRAAIRPVRLTDVWNKPSTKSRTDQQPAGAPPLRGRHESPTLPSQLGSHQACRGSVITLMYK